MATDEIGSDPRVIRAVGTTRAVPQKWAAPFLFGATRSGLTPRRWLLSRSFRNGVTDSSRHGFGFGHCEQRIVENDASEWIGCHNGSVSIARSVPK